MTGESAEEPPAPVFFLSYARSKGAGESNADGDELVIQLFRDLNRHIAQLLSSLPGQPFGFMDRAMQGNELWKKRLLRAVGSCQVLVALLSTRYLEGSGWCAREWDLFSRRTVTPKPGTNDLESTAILPVLWAPIKGKLPVKVEMVQRFSPSGLRKPAFGARYADEGIYGLLTQDPEAYATIVWKLALRIQTMCAAQYVEPWIPEDETDLADTFGEVRQ